MRKLLGLTMGALVALTPSASAAVQEGAPDQVTLDGGPGSSSMSGGTWADMPGGRTARPYVKRLSVVNDGVAQLVYSGGPAGQGPTQAGDVTAAVGAVNLCKTGQTGTCYASPNRVAIDLGYVAGSGSIGRDFAHPSVPLREVVGPDTVLDVVVGLSSVGRTLRWTWANGDLESWKTARLGTADGEVHLRLHPVPTPQVDWSAHPGFGCSGTPITECELDQADGEFLTAGMILSVDDTLPAALTGAVFATQHALLGYLQPGDTSADPTLDLQMGSSHRNADGTQQYGTLQAFLPAGALRTSYDASPEEATTLFSATRVGDPGTSDPPVFSARPEDDLDSAGLLVTIRNISFSAPTYRLARRTGGGAGAGTAGGGPGDPAAQTGGPSGAPQPTSRPAGGTGSASAQVRVVRASCTKGVRLEITGAHRGTASATLIVRGKAIARAVGKVSAAGSVTLDVKLTRKAGRTLRKLRKAKLRLAVPGEAPQTATVVLTAK